MRKLIVAYSYTGNSGALAKRIAKEQSAGFAQAEDIVRPGTFKAYTLGCFAAIRGKQWEIKPLSTDLAEYDEITIVGPIWGGCLAPQVNSIIQLLPQGKAVRIITVSGSGKSSGKDKAEALIRARGCTLKDYRDTKA